MRLSVVPILLRFGLSAALNDILDSVFNSSVDSESGLNRCTTLQLFKHYKGQHIICLSESVIERHEKTMAKKRRRIHKECLKWKPPTFTRDQLRFGW